MSFGSYEIYWSGTLAPDAQLTAAQVKEVYAHMDKSSVLYIAYSQGELALDHNTRHDSTDYLNELLNVLAGLSGITTFSGEITATGDDGTDKETFVIVANAIKEKKAMVTVMVPAQETYVYYSILQLVQGIPAEHHQSILKFLTAFHDTDLKEVFVEWIDGIK